MVVRDRPGVFSADRVIVHASPVAAPGGGAADREVLHEELDCGERKVRPMRTSFYAGDSLVTEVLTSGVWTPVDSAGAAGFRASCEALKAFDTPANESSAVEEMPRLTNIPAVMTALRREYPSTLRSGGITGTVTVRLRVRSDGTVDPASLEVQSTTRPEFAEAALRVVRTMRFRPARVHGHPIASWVVLPVNFAQV
jgi:protein TonB